MARLGRNAYPRVLSGEEIVRRTPESAGKCEFCGTTFSKRQILDHLSQCAYPETKDVASVAQLRVDAPGSPFWLDVDVKMNAAIGAIDEALRDIWLECCGHLSAFEVGDMRYVVAITDVVFGMEPDERSMDTRVSVALPPVGTVFGYEYDYGSTTRLRLKVIAHRHAPSRRKAVRLLARNHAPVWKCTDCDAAAASLCGDCSYEGDAFYCEAHAESHECGEEAMLPVANSPRMGVCGYTGGA